MATVRRIVAEAIDMGRWDRPLPHLHKVYGDRPGKNHRFRATLKGGPLSPYAIGILCSITLRDARPAWFTMGDRLIRKFTGTLEFAPGLIYEGSMDNIQVRDVEKLSEPREFEVEFVYLNDITSRLNVHEATENYALCMLGTDDDGLLYARCGGFFIPSSELAGRIRRHERIVRQETESK